MARRDITPGQRYQPTDSTVAWVVQSLSKDGEGIAHARLMREDDPTATKTLSVVALRDPKRFRLLPDPVEVKP